MKKYLTWALLSTSYLTVSHAQTASVSEKSSAAPVETAQGSSSLKEMQRALTEGRERVSNNQKVLDVSEGELRGLEKQYFGELVKSIQDGTFNIPQPVSPDISNLISAISAKLGQIEGLEGQISSQQAQLNALLEQRKTQEAQIQVLQKSIQDTLDAPDQSPTTISAEQRREFEDKLSSATLALEKLNGEIDSLEAEVAAVMDAKRLLDVALDQINNGDKSNPCLPPSVLPTVKSQIERELAGHNETIQGKNAEISRKVIERDGLEKSKERTLALKVEAEEKAVRDAKLGHEEKVSKRIGELDAMIDGLAQNRTQENGTRDNISGIESQIDELRAGSDLLGRRLEAAILAQSGPSFVAAAGASTAIPGSAATPAASNPAATATAPSAVTGPSAVTVPASGGSVAAAGASTAIPGSAATPAASNPAATATAPSAVTGPSAVTVPASGGSVAAAGASTVKPVTGVAPAASNPAATATAPSAVTSPSAVTVPASGGAVTPAAAAPATGVTPTATTQPKRSFADVLKSSPSTPAQQPKAGAPATGVTPTATTQPKRSFADVLKSSPSTPAQQPTAATAPATKAPGAVTPAPATSTARGGTTPAPLGKR